MFYRFFASHSLQEEGQVLVAETSEEVVGFAKLIDFQYRQPKSTAAFCGLQFTRVSDGKASQHHLHTVPLKSLKQEGAAAVFASTQRRNVAALSVLSLQGFRRMGFLEFTAAFRLASL